jgi:hypothetical protein
MAYTFACLGVRQIAQSARLFSPAMNALGPNRKWRRFQVMSALPHKADIDARDCDGRFVPNSEVGASFYHLVGASEEARRNFETKRLRGFQVNYEHEFGRLLDRQVGRLRTLENPVDEDGGLTN